MDHQPAAAMMPGHEDREDIRGTAITQVGSSAPQ